MKLVPSIVRIAPLAVIALLSASCKNKNAELNPYGSPPANGSGPYYGGTGGSGGAPYGGGNEYPDVQPTPPPSNYGGGGGYTAPAPAPAPTYGGGGGGGGSHTVVKGDTLFSIARRNSTSVSALKSANGLSSDMIRTGQVLRLP